MVNVVAREDADILTMLFPIKIVLNIFPGFESIFSTRAARLSPPSASVWIRTRFTQVRDVSAEEKNAESISRIIMVTI